MKFTGLSGFTTRSQLNFDIGPAVTGSLGYVFGNGFRAEGEFGYRSSPSKNITLSTGGTTPTSLNLKAENYAYSYMANALYDFPTGWVVTPHVGGGIGVVNLSGNRSGSTNVFGYQVIGGFEYAFTSQLRLGLDYRYLGTEDAKLTYSVAGTPVARTATSAYDDHAVLVTLRWNFGTP
jgi:opacity protein-like surface antigen